VLRLHVPVAGAAATLALDRLLQVAPFGVHERPDGLVLHAQELPPLQDMRAALGVQDLAVSDVSDAAAERLAEIARPEPVDGRLLVRADWMAPLPDVTEVVLADASAFGTGGHPTTRDCLSMLLALEPGGAFADLGCGAGVLAIAAAKLGWGPVSAVDVAERAVAATRANAAANGVDVDATHADLTTDPPPVAPVVAANVPVHVHAAVANAWERPPERLIVSGVHVSDREAVLAVYGAEVLEERVAGPWLTLLLRPGEAGGAVPAPAEPDAADVPPSDGDRPVELGARAALFELPGDVRFDVWALDDSLRWALRGPAGTTMEVEEETRLPGDDETEGRPPSTVRLRMLVRAPALTTRVTVHVTVASEAPGLVRVGGTATAEIVAAQS
jgi:ribosomal protein L11 methyltransferase